MLYAVRYEKTFLNKREEHLYQKELSRRLLDAALRREYGLRLSGLVWETGPCGKPGFADSPVKFSLSHCGGLVCCVLSGEEIGVDCERLRPYDPRLAERVCTLEEMAFLNGSRDRDRALTALWTLKESLMKLSGRGFAYGFKNAAFSFENGKPVCRDPRVKAAGFWEVPGFAVSVCGLKELPPGVVQVSLEELY